MANRKANQAAGHRKKAKQTVASDSGDSTGEHDEAGFACTIRDLVTFLSPSLWPPGQQSPPSPSWPPDLFAIVASILEKSGAYIRVVGHWPPPIDSEDDEEAPDSWAEWIQDLGGEWRVTWPEPSDKVTAAIKRWWTQLTDRRALPLSRVSDDGELCHALLQLLAISDEACLGIGTSFFEEKPVGNSTSSFPTSRFWWRASDLLSIPHAEGSTLCDRIHPSRARVLPKSKTPLSGMTLRSLSLYLALCSGCEVKIRWYPVAAWRPEIERYINLLLVPWPERIVPAHFRSLSRTALPPTDPTYAMFGFDPDRGLTYTQRLEAAMEREERIRKLIEKAKELSTRVDGVVLPESAISLDDYETIWKPVAREGCLLIAGVRSVDEQQFGVNRIEMRVPLGATSIPFQQAKHHRWKLDRSQIQNYGISSQLHPDHEWWEGIEIVPRELNFIALHPWLTICNLICEDLARQEPIAEIIRSVGPSLVIALLMDGPQLKTRWSSRYATVLADDPGSSVLTLSSIGMVNLSRPLGENKSSRVIALWKDPLSGAVEIELPAGADGVLINLVNTEDVPAQEAAADGRYDEEADKTLILGGIHPIRIG